MPLTCRAAAARQPAAHLYGDQRNLIYPRGDRGRQGRGHHAAQQPELDPQLRSARGTRIDGIRILTGTACSTDGIDIVSSSDVLVENVFVRSNDDCVVVKNMVDSNNDIRNITVRKAVFWNMPCGNGIEIGFELRGAKVSGNPLRGHRHHPGGARLRHQHPQRRHRHSSRTSSSTTSAWRTPGTSSSISPWSTGSTDPTVRRARRIGGG